MHVPFLDLRRSGEVLRAELIERFNSILSAQSFVLGPEVESLEQEIAGYCDCKYAVGVASGTDALTLSLKAIGVGQGDGVITTPFSFIATASSIVLAGGIPIFVDIDEGTFNISPARIEELLRQRAKKRSDGWYLKRNSWIKLKAILPVHLYGQCADMEGIMMIARECKLKVIEDAAQSLGAECRLNQATKRAGSIGDAGCISFYPTKNLGGMGDGGMVVTNSQSIANAIRLLRVHGMGRKKYIHEKLGYNSRLDALQAAGLRIKLRYLESWNEERIKIAMNYRKFLKDSEINQRVLLPEVKEGYRHIYHQFVIRVRKKRDGLRKYLAQNGIGTEVYYPLPLHLQPCFRYLGYKRGDLPFAERTAKEVLALPVYPGLKEEEQRHVVEKINEFFVKE